jgi:SNF2 family DNA or RNA helicase
MDLSLSLLLYLLSQIGLMRFRRNISPFSANNRFTPDIPCILYHGDKAARESLRQKHMSKKQSSDEFPIVVTSYEIVMNDKQFLSKIGWKFIIIDEGKPGPFASLIKATG